MAGGGQGERGECEVEWEGPQHWDWEDGEFKRINNILKAQGREMQAVVVSEGGLSGLGQVGARQLVDRIVNTVSQQTSPL
jgi:hypothetical protein